MEDQQNILHQFVLEVFYQINHYILPIVQGNLWIQFAIFLSLASSAVELVLILQGKKEDNKNG